MQRARLSFKQITIALLLAGSPSAAWCGTFTVSPVRIQVSASRPNAVLQVTNHEDQPVTFQAHVVLWRFDGQKDVYTDSNDVMLNPPIATIGPHQTQFIRLGLRHPVEGPDEESYRLIVEEVPQLKPGFRGVQTVLRLSIPIFASPKGVTSSRVNWQVSRTSDSRLRLVATNSGSAHIQIKSLEVTAAESQDGYLKGNALTYLLPTQKREWLIDDKRAMTTRRINIVAVTDAGVLHEMVEIGQ
jgi:fimbrial chaperone protein